MGWRLIRWVIQILTAEGIKPVLRAGADVSRSQIRDGAIIGHRASIRKSVYPRLKIPVGIEVPRGTELTGPADVLAYL